jgi:BlaI family transcriptional regulator, penicillinase repressor
MKEIAKPTESELEIMHILWENGASSVRFVNDELCKKREVVYTTTLKMMQNMYEKGLVTRDDSSRTHIYAAAIEQQETQKNLLNYFVNTTFRGSAMQMVMQALGNHNASESELAEIKSLIEQLEKK